MSIRAEGVKVMNYNKVVFGNLCDFFILNFAVDIWRNVNSIIATTISFQWLKN